MAGSREEGIGAGSREQGAESRGIKLVECGMSARADVVKDPQLDELIF